ncbi:MAG TPA: hypothetical protein VMZ26_07950 [Pyrinomonadaceae bacterium]|nr:hypothetical protein [Pyrinomonadaceae bacterium]
MKKIKTIGIISFALGVMFVGASSASAQSMQEERREMRRDVRDARQDYRRDVRRGRDPVAARREMRRDVRQARREYRRETRRGVRGWYEYRNGRRMSFYPSTMYNYRNGILIRLR